MESNQRSHPADDRFLKPFMDVFSGPNKALESLNYEVIEKIGGGGFADVLKCRNRETNRIVAIKVIAILDDEKEDGIPSSIIREVSVLKELNHINIVRLLDVHYEETDMFLVFEYLGLDLGKFITQESPMQPQLIKNLLHQILSGLAYCHSHKILHRDLKPQNILVDHSNTLVKLADFGLAKHVGFPLSAHTNHMASLYYTAPELLVGSTRYSTPVDVWSVGCIFAEMLVGQPLFKSEKVYKILPNIFRLLGTPTEETWPGVTSMFNSLKQFGSIKPKDLQRNFPKLEPDGVDLLSIIEARGRGIRGHSTGVANLTIWLSVTTKSLGSSIPNSNG